MSLAWAHLHNAAQVLHIHALRFNDLHHHPVHVRQLRVGRHGVRNDRGVRAVRHLTAGFPPGAAGVAVPLVSHPV